MAGRIAVSLLAIVVVASVAGVSSAAIARRRFGFGGIAENVLGNFLRGYNDYRQDDKREERALEQRDKNTALEVNFDHRPGVLTLEQYLRGSPNPQKTCMEVFQKLLDFDSCSYGKEAVLHGLKTTADCEFIMSSYQEPCTSFGGATVVQTFH